MQYVVLIGRIFYSLIFILASLSHFFPATMKYAAQEGVPMASFLVPVWGILALLGGLSVLVGYRARIGAWLLVIFLVPITLKMHAFWGLHNPMLASIQEAMFLKNLSMLGGALFIAYFGSGPFSLDNRNRG